MPTRSSILYYSNYPFAFITLFFGLSYTLSPRNAYDFFGFPNRPSTPADQDLMDKIMILYGAKDLYMSAVALASLLYGTRRSAALVTLAGGLSAGVDGYVVGQANAWGGEQWNHWGYGSVMVALGALQLITG